MKNIKKGNIAEAIKIIRLQIAENLIAVHNFFSDLKLSSPEDVYDFYHYNKVRVENSERFRSYKNFANLMRDLEYNKELNIPDEDTLDEYIGLEASVKEAMKFI